MDHRRRCPVGSGCFPPGAQRTRSPAGSCASVRRCPAPRSPSPADSGGWHRASVARSTWSSHPESAWAVPSAAGRPARVHDPNCRTGARPVPATDHRHHVGVRTRVARHRARLARDGAEQSASPGRCRRPAPVWPTSALRRDLPGHVVIATQGGSGARIRVSTDLGGTWRRVAEFGSGVADVTWVERDGEPTLLAVGDRGLHEIPVRAGAVPAQNIVDAADPDRGFQAIASFVDIRGRTGVALAAEAAGGIWAVPERCRGARRCGRPGRVAAAGHRGQGRRPALEARATRRSRSW